MGQNATKSSPDDVAARRPLNQEKGKSNVSKNGVRGSSLHKEDNNNNEDNSVDVVVDNEDDFVVIEVVPKRVFASSMLQTVPSMPRSVAVQEPPLLKVVVVGSAGAGCTSITRRMTGKEFRHHNMTTIGVDCVDTKIDRHGFHSTLQLWDCAAPQHLRDLMLQYCKGANGAILVADCTRADALESVAQWRYDLQNIVGEGEMLPCILFYNKWDISTRGADDRMVEELDGFCRHHNIIAWFAASAKEGNGLREGMSVLVDVMLHNFITNPPRQRINE